jgi:hypothetical protein
MSIKGTIERASAQKKKRGFPQIYRNILRPVPNRTTCSSSPGARKSVSIAIPFDHLRKKVAVMQKANVSKDVTEVNSIERMAEVPGVHH